MARYKDYVTQSILVPKSHPDVRRRGIQGAIDVARRHGAEVFVPEDRKNYIRFRQFDPSLASGQYVTLSLPSGVKSVSAKLSPAASSKSLRRVGGRCLPGGRRRVVCEDEFVSADKNIVVRVRTTEKERDALRDITTVGAVLGHYGRGRVHVRTKKLGAIRGRAARSLERVVANPTHETVTVRKTKRGYVFCRTVSKKETRRMAKLFDRVRGNPYASQAQRRLFHAMAARGEMPMSVVREYDRASRGMKLPERVRRRNPSGDPVDAFLAHAYADSFIRRTLTPEIKKKLSRDIALGQYDRAEALEDWKWWALSAASTYPTRVSESLIDQVAREMRIQFEATA